MNGQYPKCGIEDGEGMKERTEELRSCDIGDLDCWTNE